MDRFRQTVRVLLVAAVLGRCCFDDCPAAESAGARRPNMVILLADDLGYADVGFTGGRQIQTPQLDRLAAAGARLEQFYVQPLCSPTRAALLTGRYPMRYGLQVGVIRPWEQRGLPLAERTLPQALKEAGYSTALVGKWHLGLHERAYLPTRRGFDHQYGHYCGAIDYFTHERDGALDWHRDDRVCRDEGYSTHLIARDAVRWIRDQAKDQPFFLYVAFNAVHAPHQVPEKYKAPYRTLAEPRRTYAGMLAAMDEAVGQIVQAIDDRGQRTNTLIIFSSDNGGPAPGRVTSNGVFRAAKGRVYEGGVRVCAFAAWPGQIKAGSVIAQPLHGVDWYPTLLKLAGVSLEQPLPLDGRDLWPVLTQGQPSPHREILLNTTPKGGAIRVGDWKLVINGAAGSGDEADEPAVAGAVNPRPRVNRRPNTAKEELFNLAADPGEQHDLSVAHPEKLKELRLRYETYARAAAPARNTPKPTGFRSPRVWGETAGQ